jgi:Ethanolamine utilization protein EutJ (predicted chaperonin)
MHTGNYLQVHYSMDERWVTVAVSDTRAVAARFAADAFRTRQNSRGETPLHVRIVSAAQLVFEGGEQDVHRADADVISGAGRDVSDVVDQG